MSTTAQRSYAIGKRLARANEKHKLKKGRN